MDLKDWKKCLNKAYTEVKSLCDEFLIVTSERVPKEHQGKVVYMTYPEDYIGLSRKLYEKIYAGVFGDDPTFKSMSENRKASILFTIIETVHYNLFMSNTKLRDDPRLEEFSAWEKCVLRLGATCIRLELADNLTFAECVELLKSGKKISMEDRRYMDSTVMAYSVSGAMLQYWHCEDGDCSYEDIPQLPFWGGEEG